MSFTFKCGSRYKRKYDYLVFPTSDYHLSLLLDIYDEIEKFSYLPFERKNLKTLLSKSAQYELCNEIGIPCPRSLNVRHVNDLDAVRQLTFPIILKPSSVIGVKHSFRNLKLDTFLDYQKERITCPN